MTQIKTNLKFEIVSSICEASSLSSFLTLVREIYDKALIISMYRNLIVFIEFILEDHLVGFNFFNVISDSPVKFDSRS